MICHIYHHSGSSTNLDATLWMSMNSQWPNLRSNCRVEAEIPTSLRVGNQHGLRGKYPAYQQRTPWKLLLIHMHIITFNVLSFWETQGSWTEASLKVKFHDTGLWYGYSKKNSLGNTWKVSWNYGISARRAWDKAGACQEKVHIHRSFEALIATNAIA